MFNFCGAVSLQYLDLSYNCLTSVDALEDCSSLYYLNFSHNKISKICKTVVLISCFGTKLMKYKSLALFCNLTCQYCSAIF